MLEELALVHVLLAAVALISCLSVERKRAIRKLPRGVWVGIIVLVPLLGAVLWFAAGRPLRIAPPGNGWLHGRLAGRGLEPPDDDPTFLRSLDEPTSRPEPDPPETR